ncbi:MAG: hypothetical protein WCP61_08625 [Chitinophagia bacterium]
MTQIEFFKLQAKNLFRDFKTKTRYVDEESIDGYSNSYSPKYFDIDSIFLDYDVDEENFTLMNAQHLISRLVGFRQWSDLINASEFELELAKLLFDNQDKVSYDDWDIYITGAENDNNTIFDPEFRVEIFKQVFASQSGHVSLFPDYRLQKTES